MRALGQRSAIHDQWPLTLVTVSRPISSGTTTPYTDIGARHEPRGGEEQITGSEIIITYTDVFYFLKDNAGALPTIKVHDTLQTDSGNYLVVAEPLNLAGSGSRLRVLCRRV